VERRAAAIFLLGELSGELPISAMSTVSAERSSLEFTIRNM
jgi:hypothetical protein